MTRCRKAPSQGVALAFCYDLLARVHPCRLHPLVDPSFYGSHPVMVEGVGLQRAQGEGPRPSRARDAGRVRPRHLVLQRSQTSAPVFRGNHTLFLYWNGIGTSGCTAPYA